ncbi:MAG: metal-sensitive transcriptional regulator [Candidatus Bipolaricaulia bacterium]
MDRRKLLIRSRIIAGHLKGIARMIEEDRYCVEILKQMAAVQASLSRLANVLIKEHMEECIQEGIVEGRSAERVEELLDALRSLKRLGKAK